MKAPKKSTLFQVAPHNYGWARRPQVGDTVYYVMAPLDLGFAIFGEAEPALDYQQRVEYTCGVPAFTQRFIVK